MADGAIQTEYQGHLFRSRLEARWAVFFDTAGIPWKYEQEGYEVDGNRYLPDFWLPEDEVWVEVKGDPDGLRKDMDRMNAILGPNSTLPGFKDARCPLLILGDVPNVSANQTVMHPCLSRSDGMLTRTYGFFVSRKSMGATLLWDRQQSWMYIPHGRYVWTGVSNTPEAWDPKPWVWETPGHLPLILDAYKAARQARFEHGANGR
jgi:hypothetical protein